MSIPRVVIVMPTYNEKDNILRLLTTLQPIISSSRLFDISVLVVDDSSPDGTGKIVQQFATSHPKIYLQSYKDKLGLGVAYVRGFEYAISHLNADIVMEMDADFSHNPDDILRLLLPLLHEGDFVIGSRYIAGGSIPADWPKLRKANSKWGNIFARYITGIRDVRDCTSGFRAIKVSILQKIDLTQLGVKGYAFQLSLLNSAKRVNAKIIEVPIDFVDRQYGQSKLSYKDITEFIFQSTFLGINNLLTNSWLQFVLGITLLLTLTYYVSLIVGSVYPLWASFILAVSIMMSLHGLLTLMWMLYAWENPENALHHRSPTLYRPPQKSFTAIIPARHEEKVIADTIRALNNIRYPEDLKEIIVVCTDEDLKTIDEVKKTIFSLKNPSIRLLTYNGEPINKPRALNVGLSRSRGEVVCVFDAEDEPHPDIYLIINTLMQTRNVDVVQSGVQLMNFRSYWFSTLNCLEYYFWFKSGLYFFSRIGHVMPLGGNTVFFKKEYLKMIGGWDEQCLTEDTDIGFRMIEAGAKVRVIYDEEHVTREETPSKVKEFIKQRTRWNQGFLQILEKGSWASLPTKRQKVTALYILLSPVMQTLMLLYIPIALWVALTMKMPVVISLFSYIPFLVLGLQITTLMIGLQEFTKSYNLKFQWFMPLKIIIIFFPYQLLLMISALRAMGRFTLNTNTWEKTLHINAHREPLKLTYA